MERTRGSETSQYPEEKKAIANRLLSDRLVGLIKDGSSDSLSSGERNGRSPNLHFRVWGL